MVLPLDVLTANTAVLDGPALEEPLVLPLTGWVRQQLISGWAPKITTGDVSRDTELILSSFIVSNWRGGLLQRRLDEGGVPDRLWDSDADGRWENGLRLPTYAPLTILGLPPGSYVTASGQLPTNPADPTQGDDMWAAAYDPVAGATTLCAWSEGGGLFTPGAVTVTGPPFLQDAVHLRQDGADWMVFAARVGVVFFRTDGATYSEKFQPSAVPAHAPPATYVVVHDGKLWAFDAPSGMFWMTPSCQTAWDADGTVGHPNPWVPMATLPERAYEVVGLVEYFNRIGEPRIYALTKSGAWIYDDLGDAWLPTALVWPRKENAGAHVRWQDQLYLGVGASVFAFDASVVRDIGLGRESGLSPRQRGDVVALESLFSTFVVGTDATSPAPPAHYCGLYEWDGHAWQPMWLDHTPNRKVGWLAYHLVRHVITGQDVARLWWAAGTQTYSMLVPTQVFNPKDVPTSEYAPRARAVGPWYDAGLRERVKPGYVIKARGRDCSGLETIQISYALDDVDDDSAWVVVGTLQDDTLHEWVLETTPGTGDAIEWLSIRLAVDLVRDPTNPGRTPILDFVSFHFEKWQAPLYSYEVTVDCSEGGARRVGRTPAELLARLQDVTASVRPLRCEFRRFEQSLGNLAIQRVKVLHYAGVAGTGPDEQASVTIALAEKRA
ncbi:MAG TPA: hypothetical protein VE953_22470 [Terriglobales bacterium]|nr:hypothetical protein [Terriglobales bacterium]